MNDQIHLKTVALGIHANGTQSIFNCFARHLSPALFYDYDALLDHIAGLKANETAAIGGGVMIFHGWVDDWPEHTTSFIRLKKPLDLPNIPDREPVDLVLLALSPKSDGPLHLSRLSTLTRYMRDRDFCSMLRGAMRSGAVESIFDGMERRRQEKAA